MAEHDPLCHRYGQPEKAWIHCDCEAIAKARADEHEKGAYIRAALMQSELERMNLRAKVDALPALGTLRGVYVKRDDVLAILDGGGDDA